jgi:CubicO group peptidase (beta-lactamase class C family)
MPVRYLPFLYSILLVGCGNGGGSSDQGDPYHQDNPHLPDSMTTTPENSGDGWMTSTPAAEGMDEDRLRQTLDAIHNGQFPGVDSLLVARHGRLVAEGYFNGFGPKTTHDLRSAGKSFVSALAGIAIDQGLFGVDDPISQLLPGFDSHANMDDAKRSITVRNLLDMNSGLNCNDWIGPNSPGWEETMYGTRDWVGFMLDLPMANAPGTFPSYCTGGVVLLGHIITVRSGKGLDEYANTWLFGPLAIHNVLWRHSPDGQATGATGMQLRPRDAAKLGQLYLDGGAWNGARVEPADWVSASQRRETELGGDGYGYLWWKRTFTGPNGPVDTFYADGNGGNFVFVIPALDLVVGFTASNYNTDASRRPLDMLSPYVLSAVRDTY